MNQFNRAAAVCSASVLVLLSGCGDSKDASSLAITQQPASVAIPTDSSANLSVVANGSGLSYQWYKDGSPIAEATRPVFVANEAGTYFVVVDGADGTLTSANALVTVTGAPILTTQPATATILSGSTRALWVEASGADLAYQWYKDGSAVSGAAAATYTASGAGRYQVVVTNAAGSVTSDTAVLTASTTSTAPAITANPATQTANSGTTVRLSVGASGVSNTYQWYKEGTAIPGATGPVLTLSPVTGSDAGAYYAVVANGGGSATSGTATLSTNVTEAGANTAAVANAANAFLSTLSSAQKTVAASTSDATTVLFPYTLANAIQWTNLPGDRHGLRLNSSTLTAAQLAAANALISTALSSTGVTIAQELREADDVLSKAGSAGGAGTGAGGTAPGGTTMTPPTGTTMPTDGTIPGGTTMTPPTGTGTGTGGAGVTLSYGSGLYSIAFVGTPSKTSPWILQVAGHHLAYNITYNAPKLSATPLFVGVEPPNWTVAADGTVSVTNTAASAGVQHAPLERQRKAVYDLAEAIQGDSANSAAARLSATFTDVIMGASGNSDGNFKTLAYPTTGRGLKYSAMSSTQKAYVRKAIHAWVDTQAYDVAATLLDTYLSDSALNDTYVAYGVGQGGKADFGAYPNSVTAPLNAQHSYIRIDGPRVWIEFVVQQGVLYQNAIHYHTIWRDKTADYGASF